MEHIEWTRIEDFIKVGKTTDLPTDLFMWQQLIRESGMHSRSGTEPTVLYFPSPDRKGWSIEQRVNELKDWRERIIEPKARAGYMRDVMENTVRRRAFWESKFREAEDQAARPAQTNADLQREIDLLYDHRIPSLSRLVTWGTAAWETGSRVSRIDQKGA